MRRQTDEKPNSSHSIQTPHPRLRPHKADGLRENLTKKENKINESQKLCYIHA